MNAVRYYVELRGIGGSFSAFPSVVEFDDGCRRAFGPEKEDHKTRGGEHEIEKSKAEGFWLSPLSGESGDQ